MRCRPHIKIESLCWIPWQAAEVRATRNNASFTVVSLATKRSWKYRETGERRSQTTWHRCIAWGKAGPIRGYAYQGRAHVQLEGEIRTREYTQKSGGHNSEDAKKSITEVRVTSIAKLDWCPSRVPSEAFGCRRSVMALNRASLGCHPGGYELLRPHFDVELQFVVELIVQLVFPK